MNDLEKSLRHTLHALADTVPETTDPKADLDRRLATGRRGLRGPLLVAAAAAVALTIGVTVPLAVHRDDTQPAVRKKTDGLVWSHGYDWVRADNGPYVLATFTENGEDVDAVAWSRGARLCVGEGHAVDVGGTDRPPAALVDVHCSEVPAWPAGPQHNWHVMGGAVLPEGDAFDSGPLPDLMLFQTDPVVTDLDVRRGDGSQVPVRKLGGNGRMTLFLADFDGSTRGFGYSAWDADGNSVEDVVT